MSSISALKVAHNIFPLNVNLNLIQNPKQNDNKKHGCCDRSTWKSSTVRQYLLLFLKILHSVSDKTIHEIHEVIEDQNEMLYLISILEFCLIYIQGVVYPTKHFLLQLMIFFSVSINTDVSFLLASCAGLPMTYSYLIFNIMRYSKRIFTWRYQTCHTATLICQDWAIIINADLHTLRIFITTCLLNDKSFDQA